MLRTETVATSRILIGIKQIIHWKHLIQSLEDGKYTMVIIMSIYYYHQDMVFIL